MTHNTDADRAEFLKWLRIKPCGAAHDLAWSAWKAARQATAATVPQGLKLVPLVPTSEMLGAADREHAARGLVSIALISYQAMLAAAPQPPEAAPVELPEPVAYRLRNTAFRSEVYEYFRTKYLAECRQKQFNASVDDGGLHELTPIYTEQQVRDLLAAAKLERTPLSDSDICEILDKREDIAERADGGGWHLLPYAFARAIERAHGIGKDKA